MQYHLVDRDEKVLGTLSLADGVQMPEVARALVTAQPLQLREVAAKAAADAKGAGGGGGGAGKGASTK